MMLAPSSPVATSPLGWHSPFALKSVPKDGMEQDMDDHNNTFSVALSSAQMEAYSPMEDRLYVNEKENLYAIFDGHGGGILTLHMTFTRG